MVCSTAKGIFWVNNTRFKRAQREQSLANICVVLLVVCSLQFSRRATSGQNTEEYTVQKSTEETMYMCSVQFSRQIESLANIWAKQNSEELVEEQ